MTRKPGRNEPCPCGSGKKYKKCCGLNDRTAPIIPESERTGTPYDDFMEVFPLLGLYGQKILRFGDDGRELKRIVKDFETHFRPGEPDGLMDSFFMSWMHFDLRCGPSQETIVERVLQDPLTAQLAEPGPSLLRRMSESFPTFYEVVDLRGDTVVVEELGTARRWTLLYVRELYGIEAVRGEIWYTRLIELDDGAIPYTTPYIFDPASKAQFKRAVLIQKRDFQAGPRADLFPRERHFAESQKEAGLFWAEFIFRGLSSDLANSDMPSGWTDIDDIPAGSLPFFITADGEEVEFAEMRFRFEDEEALRKRLAALRSFAYDKKDDSWIWLKAQSRKDFQDARSVLGTFRIADGSLVAEANSRGRAARLRNKLEKLLGGLIVHQETRWKDQTDLPELSEAERAAYQKEDQALNARPEVREMLRKQREHYYLVEWPEQKIPMLGGITPIRAAKTEEGRRKLAGLLDFYDRMQNASDDADLRFDFDRLRRRFGLPPKAS